MPLPTGAQIYVPMNEGAGATAFQDKIDGTRIFDSIAGSATVGVNGGKFDNSVDIHGEVAGPQGLFTLTNTSDMDIPVGGEALFPVWVKLDGPVLAGSVSQCLCGGVTDASEFWNMKTGFTAGQTFLTLDAFSLTAPFFERVLIQPAPIVSGSWCWVVGERGTDGQFRFWIDGIFIGKGAHSLALHSATRVNFGNTSRFVGDTLIQGVFGDIDDYLLGTTAIYNSDANITVPTAPWLPANIVPPSLFQGRVL